MQITTDFSGLQPNGAPIVAPPPPKRVASTPLREGDHAQEDRRQNQNDQDTAQDSRPVFKALFTGSTLAGLNAASSKADREAESIEADKKQDFVRAEKRPEKGPVSLSSEDTNGLFSYIAAARQAAETNALNVAPPQAFVDATSRYTEHAAAAADVFAGRGETLELQA